MTLYGSITNTSDTTPRPLVNIAQRLGNPLESDRERSDSLSEQIRVQIPATVVSFDAATQTIVAQPTVREKVVDPATGSIQWVALPQLLDVPVFFLGPKDWVIDFTPQPGDECMIAFCDTNIDSWFESGGIQNFTMRRRHDLSDGVAYVGFRSKPNALPGGTTDGIAIRARDGSGYVKLFNSSLLGTGDTSSFDPSALEFTQAEIAGGGAKIEIKKKIQIEDVGGVPVPVIEPTINFVATAFEFNGVKFTP